MRIAKTILFATMFAGFLAGRAEAVPVLQLDMKGGVYDPVTQTIVASGGSSVEVYAILTPGKDGSLLGLDYFLSIALLPAVTGPASLGSFVADGTTYNVTSGLTYGNPPIETIASLQGYDPGDLPQHGVFPTYFTELQFNFSANNRAATYNTADNPGGLTLDPNGKSYYAIFTLDTTNLSGAYYLHFDLYDEVIRTCIKNGNCTAGDIDVNRFAPFSHDAETKPPTQVPEPASGLLLLLGSAMMAAALPWRKN